MNNTNYRKVKTKAEIEESKNLKWWYDKGKEDAKNGVEPPDFRPDEIQFIDSYFDGRWYQLDQMQTP